MPGHDACCDSMSQGVRHTVQQRLQSGHLLPPQILAPMSNVNRTCLKGGGAESSPLVIYFCSSSEGTSVLSLINAHLAIPHMTLMCEWRTSVSRCTCWSYIQRTIAAGTTCSLLMDSIAKSASKMSTIRSIYNAEGASKKPGICRVASLTPGIVRHSTKIWCEQRPRYPAR